MWTNEEKEALVSLYPNHQMKELCTILNKTEGQIRGMKERLGLNTKFNPFSEQEEEIILKYYQDNPNEIDLKELSDKINRPVSSISRWARKRGLTRQDRPLTEKAMCNLKSAQKEYRDSDIYKNIYYPRDKKRLTYYAQNNHPRGMLNKHHSDDTRNRMSQSHKQLWSSMSEDEKIAHSNRVKQGRINKRSAKAGINTYSRCRGGYREDLCCYFRSAWEANTARLLNYWGLRWEYESRRFYFESVEDGVLSYCPDFYLPDLDMWVEVKGWMDEISKVRLQKFQSEYPEESAKLVLIDESAYREIVKDFASYINEWEKT